MKKGFIAVISFLFLAISFLPPVCAEVNKKKMLIGLIPEMNIFK